MINRPTKAIAHRYARPAAQLLGVCALLTVACAGVQQVTADEAAKAAQVRTILQGRSFQAWTLYDQAFCQAFLEDFPELRGITFVEPIVHAERFDDPRLQAYQARCPNRPMNQLEVMTRPQDEAGWKYYGTRNFKLFQAEMNDNPNDGAELIFYAERFEREDFYEGRAQRRSEQERKISEQDRYRNGKYGVINPKSCAEVGLVLAHDPYDYDRKREVNNVNGIIRYKGSNYIFDLYRLTTEHDVYELHIAGYSPKDGKMVALCLLQQQLQEKTK